MNEIRLGTIGSGVIVHSILDAVRRTEGIALEAVYSRNAEKGEKLAAAYGAKKVYTDLDDLFADEAVNFVYVASPNSLHYAQAKRALLSGKNVLCEKPFCTTGDQVRELTDIAKKRNLYLIDATPTAFLPNFEAVREQLPLIGRPRLVQCSYCQYSSRYDQVLSGELPNIFNPEFAGGCLHDINYYNVYFNVALFGMPEEAVYYPNLCATGVDSSGVMVMRYPGFTCECTGAKDTWGVNSVQIQGEKGYILIENGANGVASVRTVTKGGETLINRQPDPDRWYYEIQGVTRLVLAGERDALYRRLAVTAEVIDVIEASRKRAGIRFGGE